MSKFHKKLADSLTLLESIQTGGSTAIRSTYLTRTHKDRLLEFGFLRKVIKGWYRSSRPDAYDFDDSGWLAAYWDFMSEYLEHRFGENWCFSTEQSILLYAGNNTVPIQLIVRASVASNKITQFPYKTSLYEVKAQTASEEEVLILNGLRLFRPELALTSVREDFIHSHLTEVKTVLLSKLNEDLLLENLRMVNRIALSETLISILIDVGKTDFAKRIASSMNIDNMKRDSVASKGELPSSLSSMTVSPYVNRIRLLWKSMRKSIIQRNFPSHPDLVDGESYIRSMEELYVKDAYHSLSIEGYQVTHQLLKAIQDRIWPAKHELQNVKDRNALAAVGYRRSFQKVKETIQDVLEGKNPGLAISDDIQIWFQTLFSPSVEAGIMESSSLIGYRNNQVYIRGSRHVPMNADSLRDCMEVFFNLLEEESDSFTRVVLGHFFFVYIHPYFDGNGRIARFIMNVLFAAAGIPWQVIEIERRTDYFKALEKASTDGDILPFALFL